MATPLNNLLELANFKHEQHFDTAKARPQQNTLLPILGRGIWKSVVNGSAGEVQTLHVRLGDDLLEIKHYPEEYPGQARENLVSLWLFDVSGNQHDTKLFVM